MKLEAFGNCLAGLRDGRLISSRPSTTRLGSAPLDGSAGTVRVLQWMIPMIRRRWPNVRLIVRGDSGFARESIMSFCEANGVDYVLGLARNKRLQAMVKADFGVQMARRSDR